MINLLPPKQKEELERYRVRRIVIVLGVIITAFLIAFALVLLTLNIYLQGEVNYLSSILKAKRGKNKTSEIESIQDKFKNYNKRVSKIQGFYEQQDHPSDFLQKLNSTLPQSVYLTSLSYKKVTEEDYKARVGISGYCPDRDTLFQLKRKMDEKDQWEALELPPSNWVEPTDINFKVNFKIKSETEE